MKVDTCRHGGSIVQRWHVTAGDMLITNVRIGRTKEMIGGTSHIQPFAKDIPPKRLTTIFRNAVIRIRIQLLV